MSGEIYPTSSGAAEDQVARAKVREEVAAIQRDAALDAAESEAIRGDVMAASAIDSRIAENQARAAADELATDRNILHGQLAAERAATASNAFGFYLMVGIVLAIIVVAGFYMYWRPVNAASTNIYSGPAPAPTTNINPAPVIVSSPRPVIVPPPVINNPPKPEPAPNTTINNRIVIPPANPSNTPADGGSSQDQPRSTGENGVSGGNSDSSNKPDNP